MIRANEQMIKTEYVWLNLILISVAMIIAD